MNKKLKYIARGIFVLTWLGMMNVSYASNAAPKEKNNIVISAEAQKMAGIQVLTLQPQALPYVVSAPGEVVPNADSTTKVSSRVPAQVLQRYVQEGQHVKVGELLINLTSVDMAKTQGDLLLAWQEWERVKSLGKDAISAKRYSEAQVNYQRAYSTAMAYGMTEAEVNNLLQTQKPSIAKGEFKLFAPRAGTIFNINFTEGEIVDVGKVLLQIVEEKSVWINAKLPPDLASPIRVNDSVQVKVGERILNGKIIQVHHQLDETTRTRSVRIEVSNEEDLLHPGQFVDCKILAGKTAPVLSLPVDAVLRTTDGDWAVYIEKQPNQFQQAEVKVSEVINDRAIIQGLSAGQRVVIKGAFFVHSEFNKSGFEAGH